MLLSALPLEEGIEEIVKKIHGTPTAAPKEMPLWPLRAGGAAEMSFG